MQLSTFSTWVLTFIIAAVIIGIGATILFDIGAMQCAEGVAGTGADGIDPATGQCYANATTIASNATAAGMEGTETFGNWLPTIAVIIAAAVVIGIIINYFRA